MITDSPGSLPATVHLAGHGLILREWADEDVPAMAALFDDPLVDHFTPLRSPFDLAAARAYLDKARDDRAAGRRVQLAITTDGATPKGEILLSRTGDADNAELAYAIGSHHRRQRLATRAVQLITGYAYTELAMNQVLLRIPAENIASAAVARAAGFRLTDAAPITRENARYPLLTWAHTPST
jgi:RimJ/RimL family protein N-acetyltransferase